MSTAPKKRKKSGLGKGLGALIPASAPPETDASAIAQGPREYRHVPLDAIRPNRYQPRRNFSGDELADLTDSIREQGIIQPLVVRKDEGGFELMAGERRLRAARAAGLERVPVMVRELTDAQMLEMSIVENIQRENLNPLEEAEAYHRLMSEFGLTQDGIAGRVGKSRSAVANFLRLRRLPVDIRDAVGDGRLTMGHAKALMGTEDTDMQIAACRKVLAGHLSVRQTEELMRDLKNAPPPKPSPAPPHPEEARLDRHLADVTERLIRRFGTKVQIRRKGTKGRLEIEFLSDEDLDRLLSLLDA